MSVEYPKTANTNEERSHKVITEKTVVTVAEVLSIA